MHNPYVPILTSALLFASAFLVIVAGYRTAWVWFDARAGRDAERYASWIDELFLNWTPTQAKHAAYAANGAIIAVAFVTLLLTGSPVFAAAAAFGAYWIPLMLYRVARNRRLKRFEEQLPDAIEVMVASVRAGRSLAQAIEDVAAKISGPVGQEFGVMASEYRDGGLSVEEALRRTRARLKVESFTMISSALIINSERGGDVLTMLERMSDSIRELTRLKKKIVSEMAEVRAQEKIILTLTPIFGALVCVADPEIPNILFHTFLGNLLLVMVIATQAAGILWIRRIVRTSI